MLATLDVVKHNENSISIMDMDKDLDISDAKWNFVFDYLMEETNVVYFMGWHLDASYKYEIENDLIRNVDFLAEEIFEDKDSHHRLFFKVKQGALVLSRSLLSKVWLCYDYPALVFLKDSLKQKELIDFYSRELTRQELALVLEGVFITFRVSQYNVLWLEKNGDMTFPWETTRSPIAIEQEANRPWYERLLNKMEISWTIRINRE